MKRTLVFLSSAAVATMMLSSCAKSGDQAGTTADSSKMTATNNLEANKASTRRFYEEVMNGRKMETIDALCATNFVDHNPDPGSSGQGTAELKKEFAGWFASMPDMHITIDQMAAEGDMVWTMFHFTGTMKGDMGPMKATNKSCNVGGIDVVRIKDGKAVERWGYVDQMAMMQQLGMMPTPGGNAPPPGNAKKM